MSSTLLLCLSFIGVTWSLTTSCAGFVRPNNSAFPYGLIVPTSVYTWDNGPAICKTYHPNAQFAVLRDRNAMDYIFTQLNNGYDQFFTWVALKQYNDSGAVTDGWFWYDGVPDVGNVTYPRYLLWNAGNPAYPATTEGRCGQLAWLGYALTDNRCLAPNRITCEVHGKLRLLDNLKLTLIEGNIAQTAALLDFSSIKRNVHTVLLEGGHRIKA
jgi:hypothetical protein